MSAEGGHMTDVELVPDGLDEVPVAPVPVPDADRPRRTRTPRAPRRPVAALAVLGLVVGLGALVEHRSVHADTALARSVAPAGAVDSLRDPVRELWRASGRVVGGGADVLVLTETDDVRTVVSGRGARTGELLWSHEMSPARVRCPRTLESDPGPDVLVLCELRVRSAERAVSGQLWLVDPTDGTVRARRTLDARVAGWDGVDGDLVLARQDGRDLRVWREGLVDAAVRWVTVLPMPDGVSAAQVDLRVGDGLVALGGAIGAVLAADGDVLGQWVPDGRGAVVVHTDAEGFAVWTDEGEGRWFDRAGHAGVRLPGDPVDAVRGAPDAARTPFVGDARTGAAGGLLLLRTRGGVAVVDTRDRGLVWSRSARHTPEVLVVGDVVALAGPGEVRMVDLAGGGPGWTAGRGPGTDTGAVLTDGLRLLVPGHEPGVGRAVTVRSLADGRVEWSVPLPPGVAALEVGPEGVLLARVPGGVVVVGP